MAKRTHVYPRSVLLAAQLLGSEIKQARIERRWTARELAERAGITPSTLSKVERGDPTVMLGTAFDVANLVGVALFDEDKPRLAAEAARSIDRAALIRQRVRSRREENDGDF